MDLDGRLLALAGHRSEKVEKVDLLWKICQHFQYITALLATTFQLQHIPLALSFHIHLFSLHSSPPYILLLPTKVHKEIPHLHNITYVFIIHTAAALGCYLLDS